MTIKASIYLRCSTLNQDTGSQRREIELYCERQGWKIHKIFEDKAISGAKGDRPALNKMMEGARNGSVGDLICVYKIDRLARSVADLLRILTDLKACNVGFVSVSQGIDTSTSYGKMVLTFLGAVAEFERETIVERVRSGLDRAKANGVRLGRPKTSFDIGKALKLKRQGQTWSELSKVLNVSRATIRRVITPLLKNPHSLKV